MCAGKKNVFQIFLIFGFFILFNLLAFYQYAWSTKQTTLDKSPKKNQFSTEMDVYGWEKVKIRKASLYINLNNDTAFTHFRANICSARKPLVVIIVCSNPENINLRKEIRKTWAKDANNFRIEVLFLIGISRSEVINKATSKESIQYKDIIKEDMIDTYNNLTLKSIYMLKWVKNNCMQARFLMKVDDDTYINIEKLYEFASLISDSDLKSFLVGYATRNSVPYRKHTFRWYMPRYMYPDNKYPTYLQGVGYLMSTYVAEKLYHQSLQNEFIHMEDVYITGICSQQIHVPPSDNYLFHYSYYPKSKLNCKSFDSRLIVLSHHIDASHVRKFHNQLNKC